VRLVPEAPGPGGGRLTSRPAASAGRQP